MAGKIDKEFFQDAKREHKKQSPLLEMKNNLGNDSFENKTNETGPPPPPNDNGEFTNAHQETNKNTNTQNQSQPQPDELKEKFDEFAKGLNFVTGAAITEIIDDFKTKLLFVHAEKKGCKIPIEALKMDPKAKEFCAYLVDYAVKNKVVDWVKKYPLIAAGGVVAITGGMSYMFIEMMSKKQNETEKLKKELEFYKSKEEKSE